MSRLSRSEAIERARKLRDSARDGNGRTEAERASYEVELKRVLAAFSISESELDEPPPAAFLFPLGPETVETPFAGMVAVSLGIVLVFADGAEGPAVLATTRLEALLGGLRFRSLVEELREDFAKAVEADRKRSASTALSTPVYFGFFAASEFETYVLREKARLSFYAGWAVARARFETEAEYARCFRLRPKTKALVRIPPVPKSPIATAEENPEAAKRATRRTVVEDREAFERGRKESLRRASKRYEDAPRRGTALARNP